MGNRGTVEMCLFEAGKDLGSPSSSYIPLISSYNFACSDDAGGGVLLKILLLKYVCVCS